MDVETFFKRKKNLLLFDLFLSFFLTLPITQTIKVIDLFFEWVGPKKIGQIHPIPIL